MKKIILTENQYRLLLENRTPPMTEVLGSSMSAFTERFEDSAFEFQELIDEIFTNEDNYREDNGNVILISKSGSEIPFENFKNYIQDIVNGKSVFDLQNKFPSVLKGGTVLRGKIIELLSNPNDSDEDSSEQSEYPLNSKGINYLERIKNEGNWIYLNNIDDGDYSGWKLHVYTTKPEEIAYVGQQIVNVAKRYKAGLKLASQVNLNALAKDSNQIGKGVTVQFPYSVIRTNNQRAMLKDIISAVSNLNTTGFVLGDKPITSNIGYRYEFGNTPLPVLLYSIHGNFDFGLKSSFYKANYTSNIGDSYNSADFNPDIFETRNYVDSALREYNAYKKYQNIK
jgi:hypothetical protein